MLKPIVSVAGVALLLVVGAFMMVAVSTTVDLDRVPGDVNGPAPRIGVEAASSDVVEWLPNTLEVYQDRVLGQVEAKADVAYLLVRAKLMNPEGLVCESSFDHTTDLWRGDRWTFEIPSSGCTTDKVLLYARSF